MSTPNAEAPTLHAPATLPKRPASAESQRLAWLAFIQMAGAGLSGYAVYLAQARPVLQIILALVGGTWLAMMVFTIRAHADEIRPPA